MIMCLVSFLFRLCLVEIWILRDERTVTVANSDWARFVFFVAYMLLTRVWLQRSFGQTCLTRTTKWHPHQDLRPQITLTTSLLRPLTKTMPHLLHAQQTPQVTATSRRRTTARSRTRPACHLCSLHS